MGCWIRVNLLGSAGTLSHCSIFFSLALFSKPSPTRQLILPFPHILSYPKACHKELTAEKAPGEAAPLEQSLLSVTRVAPSVCPFCVPSNSPPPDHSVHARGEPRGPQPFPARCLLPSAAAEGFPVHSWSLQDKPQSPPQPSQSSQLLGRERGGGLRC